MGIEGVIIGGKELLPAMQKSRDSFQFVGSFNRYFSDGLIMRLLFGTPERRAQSYAIEKAKKEGANIGIITDCYNCSSMHLATNEFRLWVDLYRMVPREAVA